MTWKAIAVVSLGFAVSAAMHGSDPSIWNDSAKVIQLGNERIARSDFREGLALLETAVDLAPQSETALASLANAFHLQRRLDEAAARYQELLRVAPASSPTRQQEEAILRFAPRVFQARTDPFPLKDVVAIHHPREP